MDREKQIQMMKEARERAERIAAKTLASSKVREAVRVACERERDIRRSNEQRTSRKRA